MADPHENASPPGDGGTDARQAGRELPDDVAAAAEALTRRARRASDAAADAYRERRDAILDEHGHAAHVRDDDGDAVLVCYPDEWVVDGEVRTGRIEDLDRAVERPLEGPGEPDEWDAVAEHNYRVADRVGRVHGEVHGDNAVAFADFVSNHYAKRVEAVTPAEVAEFLDDYFVRNAWPSDEQRAVVEESVELVLEMVRE